MWFSRELQQRMKVFIVSIPNAMSKKEREVCEFEMNEEFVCLRSSLSYYNIISA